MCYLVTVTARIDHEDLDNDDKAIEGVYLISDRDAEDYESALDYFHDHIGIHVLDDFEILCEEISTTDSRIDVACDI
jgi:hypothetical protein